MTLRTSEILLEFLRETNPNHFRGRMDIALQEE
jgi:hypothetical protein